MQFGIVTLTWVRPFQTADVKLFRKAAACGFEAVEIAVSEPRDLDLPALRSALEETGLRASVLVMLKPDADISSNDAWRRENGFDLISRCIVAAAEIGAGIVGGPLFGNQTYFAGRAPRHPGPDERKRRIGWCVDNLRRLGDLAGADGITLGVEPLNRYETSLVNLVAHGKELLAQAAHPHLGLVVDTFHACMEERDVAAAIREAGTDLCHFQANENHRGVPGSGHMPWKAIGEALAEIDYRGLVILEPFRRREQPLGSSLALWRAPDQPENDPSDAELATGLRLLRTAFDCPDIS